MKYGIWHPSQNCWYGMAYLTEMPSQYQKCLNKSDGRFETDDINAAFLYLELCHKHRDTDNGIAYVKEKE